MLSLVCTNDTIGFSGCQDYRLGLCGSARFLGHAEVAAGETRIVAGAVGFRD